MITFAQLTQIADRDGVDSATVERDYVLMQVLAAVYSADRSSALVFKGGTLLRRATTRTIGTLQISISA